jgi:uroporphyrinogen decarboxylase
MAARDLKAAYGREITFHGAVERMSGPVDDLIAEVKERIDVLGLGGGYIFASCNHMVDVPPRNIVAMFETARGYRPARR